jgi:hypothetical protein
MPYEVLPTPQAADAGLVQFEDNWRRASAGALILPRRRARLVLAAPSRQQAQKKSPRDNGARQDRAQAPRQSALFQPGAACCLAVARGRGGRAREAQAMACACHSRNVTSRQLGQRNSRQRY